MLRQLSQLLCQKRRIEDEKINCSFNALDSLPLGCQCYRDKSINGPDDGSGFAIYVLRDVTVLDTAQQPALNDIKLMSSAFLSEDDIIKHKWKDHHIIVKEAKREKMQKIFPLLHKVFVVMVNGQRIYHSRFMDPVDSSSCQNPVIMFYSRHPDGRNTIPENITIYWAYPEYWGNANDPDIRENDLIKQALISAGIFEN